MGWTCAAAAIFSPNFAIGDGVSQSKDDEMFNVEVIDQNASATKDYQIPHMLLANLFSSDV